MAPKATDLTDEATLRAFRPIKRTDAQTTARIELLVSAMSNAVRRYTQRDFLGKVSGVDPAATSAKRFVYDGSGYLSLAPFEARTITAVTLDGDALTLLAGGETIGETRYLPEPAQQTPEGTYHYLTLPERSAVRGRVRIVEVTAAWGIVNMPDDVELATLHAVADAYGNPEGAAQRNLGDGLVLQEGDDMSGGSLPRAARALLAPLVRRR